MPFLRFSVTLLILLLESDLLFERSTDFANPAMPYSINGPRGTRDVYIFGESDCGLIRCGARQDFHELREECRSTGRLFEDPVFPADARSIGNRLCADLEVVWKRPREISPEARFIVDGMSRFDVNQGRIGDCWFLAALADLTQRPDYLGQVVPPHQSFQDQYAGIVHFNFWVAGKWVDVPVDDRLPTVDGRLVFMKSTATNEFWGALLEKAYAKLHGSYTALIGGWTSEALQHFTGGVSDIMPLKSPNPVAVYLCMVELQEQNAFLGAAIVSADTTQQEQWGLVARHAYSVNAIRWVTPSNGQQVPLVRLRNPWGRREWTGRWSDNCPMWHSIDASVRQEMRLRNEEDGEFWMEYGDFILHFDILEICHLHYPECRPGLHREGDGFEWKVDCLHGEWKDPLTAGGSREFYRYHQNPKMTLNISGQLSNVTVALLQKHRRAMRTDEGQNNLSIAFDIFRVDQQETHQLMDQAFFSGRQPALSTEPIGLHERSVQFEAPPGTYVIVLHTSQPFQQGHFLARAIIERRPPSHDSRKDERALMQVYTRGMEVPLEQQRELLEQWLQNVQGPSVDPVQTQPRRSLKRRRSSQTE